MAIGCTQSFLANIVSCSLQRPCHVSHTCMYTVSYAHIGIHALHTYIMQCWAVASDLDLHVPGHISKLT